LQANEILGFDLAELCFSGPAEKLARTENCQPAILTVSIAALVALKSLGLEEQARFSAGLSLGEYSALVAAESITFSDALRLVRKRGIFMEEAAKANPGKMAALVGLSLEAVKEICRLTKAEIANLNCPGQVVVSAPLEIIDEVNQLAVERGATKVVILDTSGPFHSSWMEPAAQKLAKELAEVKIQPAKIAVVSNVTARPENTPEEIKANLLVQVKSATYWEKSVRFMASEAVKYYCEIGPGKVLKGLLRKIDPQLTVFTLEKPTELYNLKAQLP
jgi:[acyl-carrier-protein] S-malonyltransferase